ncbi:MAG TPA: TlpA disulfide reductase family protein [Candidatus Binatia bacterium]|nr:TlpA disulfide reductase family protein [Candidatus Binatia bacterium]
MKTAHRWSIFFALTGLASVSIFTAGRTHAQLLQMAAPAIGPAVGRSAIPFNLQTLDGKAISLGSFRGKPLVLNFFASWCDPCREEMPIINELAAKSAGGYNLLGIAVEDSRAAVMQFAEENKFVFPIALDLNSTVKRAYRIFGPPATFFIDGGGIIRDVVLGPITAERARAALKRMAAESSKSPSSHGPESP